MVFDGMLFLGHCPHHQHGQGRHGHLPHPGASWVLARGSFAEQPISNQLQPSEVFFKLSPSAVFFHLFFQHQVCLEEDCLWGEVVGIYCNLQWKTTRGLFSQLLFRIPLLLRKNDIEFWIWIRWDLNTMDGTTLAQPGMEMPDGWGVFSWQSQKNIENKQSFSYNHYIHQIITLDDLDTQKVRQLARLTVALNKFGKAHMFGPGTPCRCSHMSS